MRITSKGQVTIPQAIREALGLLPDTEVEWEIRDGAAVVRRVEPENGIGARGRAAIAALRGTATSGLSTDEIMALTRGEDDGTILL
jgi:AbrB family looped-hinge helix DNA binding protein